MDEDWEYDTDRELSQWRGATGQELCLWEEVTVQEYHQQQEDVMIQEISPWGAVRHQEFHQREVSVRVQWGDGTQQELYQWEGSVRVQELYPLDKEDETYQEPSRREGAAYQEPSPLEEEAQGHPHTFQQEGDRGIPGLSQVGDNRDKDLSQGKDYDVQELPQWEKDRSNQKLPQQEGVSSQGLSRWAEGINYKIWDKPLHPEKDEDAQACAQEGPGSPSSMGTKVAGEAAHELPSTSSALGSPMENGLAAAAAPAGAAEEEEPPEPLPAEVEEAPGSPALREEEPLAVTESPVPAPCSPPCSQALLDLARHISCEIVHKAVLVIQGSGQQPEEQRDLEQSTAAELEAATAGGRRDESPISALHSPCHPPSPLGAQAPSVEQEEADKGSVLAEQEPEEEASAWELECSQCKDQEHTELSQGEINKYQEGYQGEASTEQELSLEGAGRYQEGSQREASSEQELSLEEAQSHHELSDWDECIGEELSHDGDDGSYQEISDWEEGTEQGLSQGQVGSSQNLSDWEEYSEHELPHGDVSSYQEVSDWEESIGQEVSKKRPSCLCRALQGLFCCSCLAPQPED
ncbi:helicase SRCAP-like [Anomalospiza imberbis]|uniref:helicase SRCAP-like n=1 Tax=Anomalospiza imberbis TaxID=187417 RepID=UPI00358FA8A6